MSNLNTVNTEITKALSTEFAAIARHQDEVSALNIVVKDNNGNSIIERNSSGAIATRLVHFLEKSKKFEQSSGTYLNDAGDTVVAKKYYFFTNGREFDKRLIAMRAVQLSQILVHLDKFRPLEVIIQAPSTLASFKQIAYLNQTIPGAYPKGALKAHWVEEANKALRVAVDAGLVDMEIIDGVECVKHSKAYVASCISRSGIKHQVEPISNENRRKERVKQRSNPKKDGTSRDSRDALSFIEAEGQCVNTRLLDAIQFFMDTEVGAGRHLPEVITQSMHVILGCQELRGYAVLNSEYFYDLRGRIYQFAHRGPNPQASDMSKALCYHTVTEVVKSGTQQHAMFIAEFFDEVIGSRDSVWATDEMIRRVAKSPAGALQYAFKNTIEGGKQVLPFKKFFTYVEMCHTMVEFMDNGEAITQLGFGPDAKCSGAQIFSILAGCKSMAEACGLITGYDVKPADPYARGAKCAKELQEASTKVFLRDIELLSRNDIKTPFMAIQYGGGTPALLGSSKFKKTMSDRGVRQGTEEEYCEDIVIEGIRESMGPTINGFIRGLQNAVEDHCMKNNVDSFSYRHIDGFLCTKRGEASVVLTDEPFTINFGAGRGQGVVFGSFEKDSGWEVESRTSGPIQRANFVYYFPVHFVQGVDGVMARKMALESERQDVRGYSTIHDQFRSCLSDAPKLKEVVVPNVYKDMFMENDIVKHLEEQIGETITWGNPLEEKTQVVTEEILYAEDSYYFE